MATGHSSELVNGVGAAPAKMNSTSPLLDTKPTDLASGDSTSSPNGAPIVGASTSALEVTNLVQDAQSTSQDTPLSPVVASRQSATESTVRPAEVNMEHSASTEAPTSDLRGAPEPVSNPAVNKDASDAMPPSSAVQEPQSPISPPRERETDTLQTAETSTNIPGSGPTPPQSSGAVSPNPDVRELENGPPQIAKEDVPKSDNTSPAVEPSPGATASAKHERADELSQPVAKRARVDDGSGASSPVATFLEPESMRKMTTNRQKYCLNVLRQLKRSKDAVPFLQPVDPIKLQIPDYLKIVTDPQDLGTIESKLKKNDYDTIDNFIDSVQLVWTNCQRYNGTEAPINLMALRLKENFERQIRSMPPADFSDSKSSPAGKANKSKKIGKASPAAASNTSRPRKASSPAVVAGVPSIRRESLGIDGRPKREIHAPPPKSLPYQIAPQRRSKNAVQLKFCQGILKELTHKKHEAFAFPFYQPVDAKALGLHDYHTIIRNPMDLATLQSKLSAGDYESADDFEYDMRLMFRNCYKYNGPGQPVNTMGKRLESVFNEKWAEKPIPRTEGYGSDSEDDSDMEDSSKQTVQMLTKQLEAMKNQIASINSQKKKKKPKRERYDDDDEGGMGPDDSYHQSNKKGSKKRNSALDDVDETPMFPTFEQKTALSTKMGYMSEHQMPVVIQILKRTDPNFDPEDEEIELDVDKVHPKTIRLLWNWIMEDVQPSFMRKKAAPKQKKNRTVLSENEQQRQIAQLEAQLHKFEGGDADGYNSRYGNVPNDNDSNSDSDASSEEDE